MVEQTSILSLSSDKNSEFYTILAEADLLINVCCYILTSAESTALGNGIYESTSNMRF